VKRPETKEGAAPAGRTEIILRKGKEEVVLSRDWPDDVVKGVTE